MRRISRSNKAATVIAAGARTLLVGGGVAVAATPGTTPSTSPASTNLKSTTTVPAPATVKDAPTSGDVQDTTKPDLETADGAKDTDNVQRGDQSGPDGVKDTEKADGVKDTDNVQQGDQTTPDSPSVSVR